MKSEFTQKPILSISMLISGREEMKKSLESLHYFRKAFPCEVVLVDTGCNEDQRKLAEQYADKIVDFAWCDDFAAARNAGLKETTGEWFLYLDDDEWFDDPQEIVEFFLSGEYRNYNSAAYVVRNYLRAEGLIYQDSYVGRMVKRKPDVKFVGRIHEYLDPFPHPEKVFSDFVHHYGYAYQDEAAARRHAERNIEPLLKMIKEEPGKNRWVLQLAQEYFSIKEYEKVVAICKEGLAEHRKQSGKQKSNAISDPPFLGGLYAYLIIALEITDQYGEGIEWLGEAMKEPVMMADIMAPTVTFYDTLGARLYAKTEDHEESCRYLRKYIKAKKKLENDREAIEKGTVGIVSDVFQEITLYSTLLVSMEAVIRMEDESLAEKAFYMLDWSDKRLLQQENWEQRMLDACCNVPYRPVWGKIMQTLISRESGMKEMYAVFLAVEERYQQNGETEKLARLRRLISELKYDHHYLVYTKILWEARKAEGAIIDAKAKEKIEGLFVELFEKYTDKLPFIRKEVWDVAERLDIPMEPLFLKIDYRIWKDALDEWNKEASIDSLGHWSRRMGIWKGTEDIRYGIFDIKCAEGYLFCYQKEQTALSGWEEALWTYADSVFAFYRPLYKESVFETVPETLPDEIWIALHLKKLKKCRESSDDKGALSILRKCLGVSVVLEKALEAYAEVLKSEIQNRDTEAEKAKTELKELVKTLKAAAKLQIERKEYAAAKGILLQIQNCMPEDEETKRLLTQIERRTSEG